MMKKLKIAITIVLLRGFVTAILDWYLNKGYCYQQHYYFLLFSAFIANVPREKIQK